MIKTTLLFFLLIWAPSAPLGQAVGGGVIGGGVMGGGAVGSGVIGGTGGGSCDLGSPEIDFNVADLGASDGDAIASMSNSGTAGSGWDLAQSTASLKPTYRSSANCTGGGSAGCLDFDGSDLIIQSATAGLTWNKTIMCVTGYFLGNTAAATEFFVAWDTSSPGNNVFRETVSGADFKPHTASSVLLTTSGIHTICSDFTDLTSVNISVDGSNVVTGANLDGASAQDPNEFVLGSYRSAGGFYFNGELSRVTAYSSDPGKSLNYLSQCGQSKVGK